MTRIACVCVAAACLAGCAHGPKQPWGWIREPVNKTVPPGVVILPEANLSSTR